MLMPIPEVVRRSVEPITEGQIRTAVSRRELEVTRVGRKVLVDPVNVERRFGVTIRPN